MLASTRGVTASNAVRRRPGASHRKTAAVHSGRGDRPALNRRSPRSSARRRRIRAPRRSPPARCPRHGRVVPVVDARQIEVPFRRSNDSSMIGRPAGAPRLLGATGAVLAAPPVVVANLADLDAAHRIAGQQEQRLSRLGLVLQRRTQGARGEEQRARRRVVQEGARDGRLARHGRRAAVVVRAPPPQPASKTRDSGCGNRMVV